MHALSSSKTSAYHRYGNNFFYELFIDTGCSGESSGGLKQHQAYCRLVGKPEIINIKKRVSRRFGVSSTVSEGTAEVSFPFNKLCFKISMHIVPEDVQLLLSLADMDLLGIFYNNIEDKLFHNASGESITVTRFYDHPFLHSNPVLQCLFAEKELRRLHHRFGHPKADKLHHLLKRSELESVDGNKARVV